MLQVRIQFPSHREGFFGRERGDSLCSLQGGKQKHLMGWGSWQFFSIFVKILILGVKIILALIVNKNIIGGAYKHMFLLFWVFVFSFFLLFILMLPSNIFSFLWKGERDKGCAVLFCSILWKTYSVRICRLHTWSSIRVRWFHFLVKISA